MAELLEANIVYRIRPGHRRATAIDKRPVAGAVEVAELGLVGDTQCDRRHHGGADKALYAYAVEDNQWWSAQLSRPIPPGTFGENLTTSGLDVSGARIGDVWQLGERVLVQVRAPRTPCANLSARMDLPRFHNRFNRAGRVGAYLKVLASGSVRAGDPINIVERPDHGVTIRDWVHPTAESAGDLLAAGIDLAENIRKQAERATRGGRVPKVQPPLG